MLDLTPLLLSLFLLALPSALDPLAPPPLALDRRLEAPEDRQSTTFFHSAPSALHLDVPAPDDHGYFRFPEADLPFSRPTLRLWSAYLLASLGSGFTVPPSELLAWRGERLRLRLHYLIAVGTPGPLAVRVTRYRDTTTSWGELGSHEIVLTIVGRWVGVDEVIACEPGANRFAIIVMIARDPGIGEAWIDDVSLVPVGEPVTVGP